MKKVKYEGTITLVDGSTVTVADDPANNDTTATDAKTAILAMRQIYMVDASNKETIIPYHSVLKAEFTHTSVDVEDPVDDFCKEEA